jgi:predicted nuclease of restriction endonuclease-like (RecB) superfamily
MEGNLLKYNEILNSCITKIQTGRIAVAKKLNETTISVYWNIGKLLSEKTQTESYGSGVIKKLSVDLKKEFPNMGLSPRNLWDMKKFYEHYQLSDEKLRRSVAVLPWSHNLLIMSKTKSENEALFYVTKTIELGWTKDILLNYIKANAYQNELESFKTHNFIKTLPENIANHADEILRLKTYWRGRISAIITQESIRRFD